MIDWIRKEEASAPPNDDTLVLVFSPEYKETHDMRYRVMAGYYVKLHSDITHWARLGGPKGRKARRRLLNS